MKRFWTEARIVQDRDGYGLYLDSRPLKTPAKAPLIVPSASLARAIAAEWDEQGNEVDPTAMPLTRAANTTIDRVTLHHSEVSDMVSAYGESDLICYRAPHPQELVARQAAAWDPLLSWAAGTLSARLLTAEGVMFITQDSVALSGLSAAVRAHSPWELTGLHDLVTLSGSLVLGLAVSHGHLSVDEAWPLSRIDEQWNIEEWGEDAEAARQAALKEADFHQAARLLELVRAG